MGNSDRKHPGLLDYDEIKKLENTRIWWRRNKGFLGPPSAPANVVGVGLSGGGIRSASFSLGALQALSSVNAISKIDYLSTVSGGGYTGASMVAHMSENNGAFPFDEDGFEDSPTVRHIRNHGRYLFPDGFSDVLRSVGILVRGLIANIVLTLSLVLSLATLTILANPTFEDLKHSFAASIWRYYGAVPSGWLYDFTQGRFFFTQVTLAGLAIVAVFWALYRSALEDGVVRRLLGKPEFLSKWAGGWAVSMTFLAFTFIAEFQTLIIEWIIRFYLRTDGFEFSSIVSTVVGAAGFSTVLTIFRGNLINTVAKALDTPTLAGTMKALTAKLILYAGALVLPLAIYFVYLLIAASGIDFARQCPSNPLLVWLAEILRLDFKTFCQIATSAPGQFPLLPNYLTGPWCRMLISLGVVAAVALGYAYYWRRQGESDVTTWHRLWYQLKQDKQDPSPVLIAVFFGALTAVVALAVRKDLDERYWNVLANYACLSGIFLVIGSCFSENANALHGLYRDRLNAAFRLGRNIDPAKTLTLAKIKTDNAPYILVNAALNARRRRDDADKLSDDAMVDVGNPDAKLTRSKESPDPAQRGRNAEFFLFTRDYIGSDSTYYAPTTLLPKHTKRRKRNDLGIDLATAVAISGAAVSSNSGRVVAGVLSPTLALLNARLGYWMNNPRFVYEAKGEVPQTWLEVFRLYLIQEAFGQLRTDSKKVLLSDGGHIDNIGLYQLLRRRCKVIIIIDSEADPALNFGALADAQRFARIDFGHRVRIDWQPIREQSARRMRSFRAQTTANDRAVPEEITKEDHNRHFAIGEIFYGAGKEEEDKGILLYIKANMTGDEPDYVIDYERRYPTFPHETTADQFFSEEQMEAYRALGFHSVSRALWSVDTTTSVGAEKLMRQLKAILGIQHEAQATIPNAMKGRPSARNKS